ncbi:MAG: TetR/AcrR family transcriptional regulator [Actinobacteria bacterium]|nr:TetR/AcrR family transcriptional regulator [Actinomycetota bacterium]
MAQEALHPRRTRATRLDALQNRDRVIQAACKVFAEVGVDAQMTDIAKAADVGVATLYRNFPTKEDLINSVLLDEVARVRQLVEEAAQAPSAWDGLVRFFQWVTVVQLENRVLPQFVAGRIPGTAELGEHLDAVHRVLEDLTERAKKEGALRRDVNSADLRFALFAMSQVASGHQFSGEGAKPLKTLTRRLVALILDGLHYTDRPMSEGPPVSSRDFNATMHFGVDPDGASPTAFRRGRRPWPVK